MKNNSIDKQIEQAYYRLAQGKQIGIMDIPKLFSDCRLTVSAGVAVDDAVRVAIDKYCREA